MTPEERKAKMTPEDKRTWDFFHRNADRTAHLNEQRYRYGELICPSCIAEQ